MSGIAHSRATRNNLVEASGQASSELLRSELERLENSEERKGEVAIEANVLYREQPLIRVEANNDPTPT